MIAAPSTIAITTGRLAGSPRLGPARAVVDDLGPSARSAAPRDPPRDDAAGPSAPRSHLEAGPSRVAGLDQRRDRRAKSP